MWRYVTQDGVGASRAAATDAFLMAAYGRGGSLPDPTLRIFTYQPRTLLLGRFQSLSAEVRMDECARSGVALGRRLTGGGAMLMGDDQLAVSLVTSLDHPATPGTKQEMMQVYSNAVCRGLRILGLDCCLRSPHDLMVGPAKIGIADIIIDPSGAILFQAHVLVGFDPQAMTSLLRLPAGLAGESAADTLARRLTAVSREKGARVEARLVRDLVRTGFETGFGIELQHFAITPLESQHAARIQGETFEQEAWLHSRSPTAEMAARSARQTAGGLLLAFAAVAQGKIAQAVLAGDFFGDPENVASFERAVQGAPLEYEAIRAAAERFLPAGAMDGIDFADAADVLWEAVTASTPASPGLSEETGGTSSVM